MKLSPRDQIIIFAVFTVLAAVAIFFLVILPRFGEIDEYEQQITEIEQERVAVETVLNRRQDAKARAAETQVELLDIASRFPEAPDLPALIIELQDVANRVEIDFIQLGPGTPAPVEGVEAVSVIPVTVSITGTWEQYIEFLAEVGDLRREVRIVDFTASAVPPPTPDETAEEEEEGTTEETTTDEEVVEIYTISARVSLQAYMMDAELSAGGGSTEAP